LRLQKAATATAIRYIGTGDTLASVLFLGSTAPSSKASFTTYVITRSELQNTRPLLWSPSI